MHTAEMVREPRIFSSSVRSVRALALAVLLAAAAPALATGRHTSGGADTTTATAHPTHHPVPGVKNFGKVTGNIFRGGDPSPQGLTSLHDMGVHTVINLTSKGVKDERNQVEQHGMKYLSFPMHSFERPDDAEVNQILGILQNADQPVYFHCEGGRHRTGTIAALYRIRVQGWSPEQAWQEQEAYGFGPASDHQVLYEYVYGKGGPAADMKSSSNPE